MQSKNLHAKVWKVSLGNTTTWKIKSSTSSLDLCASTKLAQITVLEATKMKQKSSMVNGVHKNGAAVKNVKRCQPVKNASAVTKLRQLRHFIKAKLTWVTAFLEIFAVEFNCVVNHFLEEFFSEIS